MNQPHKNLFFFYRGATPRGDRTGRSFERQLEDNTTKALISVLERSDPSTVLSPFLRRVAGVAVGSRPDRVQFALQRKDIQRPSVRKRVLLVLEPDSDLQEIRTGQDGLGRPDAWIWRDDRFSILIENKVRRRASESQLRRHVAGASGWTWDPKSIRRVGWPEVHETLEGIRRTSILPHDKLSRLLVEHFLGYLKMAGLAGSTTFELEDFSFFALAPDERPEVQRELLADKVHRFNEALVSKPAIHRILRLYSGTAARRGDFVHPGTFRKRSHTYWITIGPKERRSRCHLTVRLSQSGISIEAFSPHKEYTEKLIRKISREPRSLVRALRRIAEDEPFAFRVKEAFYRDPRSQYKGRSVDRSVCLMQFHPRVINEGNARTLLVEPVRARLKGRKDLRPEVTLVREFGLDEVLGKPEIVRRIAEAATRMVPYLEFALAL